MMIHLGIPFADSELELYIFCHELKSGSRLVQGTGTDYLKNFVHRSYKCIAYQKCPFQMSSRVYSDDNHNVYIEIVRPHTHSMKLRTSSIRQQPLSLVDKLIKEYILTHDYHRLQQLVYDKIASVIQLCDRISQLHNLTFPSHSLLIQEPLVMENYFIRRSAYRDRLKRAKNVERLEGRMVDIHPLLVLEQALEMEVGVSGISDQE